MSGPACDECSEPARFLIFAAYEAERGAFDDSQQDEAHPLVARYPMPLGRSCRVHLDGILVADRAAPLSTSEWVVRAVAS